MSPVGLQLHPAQLHAHRALRVVGLVRDGGAQRAHAGRRHRVVVSAGRGRVALPGAVPVRLVVVVVVVVLLCGVTLRGQAEVRPQLWEEQRRLTTVLLQGLNEGSVHHHKALEEDSTKTCEYIEPHR